MELLKLSDDGVYLSVSNSESAVNVRHTLLKKLVYNAEYETIVLVLYRNNTLSLNYDSVEDPDNPGNLFVDLDALWDWLLGAINSTSIPDTALTTVDGELMYDTNDELITS